jgi:hypothetical protein
MVPRDIADGSSRVSSRVAVFSIEAVLSRPRFVGEVQKRSTRDDRVKIDRREPRFARGDARTVARFHRLEIGARDEIAAAKTLRRAASNVFFVFRFQTNSDSDASASEPAQPRRQAQHVPALGHGE